MSNVAFNLRRSSNPIQPYFFNITSTGNNRILAASETYVRKEDCAHGGNLIIGGNYRGAEIRVAANGQHYFVVLANNGFILAWSETYVNRQDCLHAANLVVGGAGGAPFYDWA